jgi:hypothetical protein
LGHFPFVLSVWSIAYSSFMMRWQKRLREVQPKMLVVWGKYDPSFTVAGATAHADDVRRIFWLMTFLQNDAPIKQPRIRKMLRAD